MAETKNLQLKIEIDDQTAQGIYANMASVFHTDSEFVFDFMFLQPGHDRVRVRSRIITSPGHAKKFLAALEDNIHKFEKQFGAVKPR